MFVWKETHFIENNDYFDINLEEINKNYEQLQSYSDDYY